MRELPARLVVPVSVVLLFTLSGVAWSQNDACPYSAAGGCDLLEVPEPYQVKNKLLKAAMVVGLIEYTQRQNLAESDYVHEQPATLRSYGYLRDPNAPISQRCINALTAGPVRDTEIATVCPNLNFSYPGPVFRLRKGSDRPAPMIPLPNDGERFQLDLYNLLPDDKIPNNKCNPESQGPNDVFPDCFHGNDVTNFHYHGSHVSPQPPQDFVLLRLKPWQDGDKCDTELGPGATRGGCYTSTLDPLLWTQAEGTHWYHPHKHGSVALQVLNGMAGGLIIEGPFDDWLNQVYDGDLEEKILITQQIADRLNFFDFPKHPKRKIVPPEGPPFPVWINGQTNPVITMRPGEIQRWRFIGATMQASAHLNLIAGDVEMVQIAQDGVQFFPENYPAANNPLNMIEIQEGVAGDPSLHVVGTELTPGGRIDFLVRAPMREADFMIQQQMDNPLAMMAAVTTDMMQPLLTVRVEGAPKRMEFPPRLPDVPEFLESVADDEIGYRRLLYFSMSKFRDGYFVPDPRLPGPDFYINGKQYDPDCVDETMVLGRAEEWRVINTSQVSHPLHIHVNPFQVTRQKYAVLQPFDPDKPETINRYRFIDYDFAKPPNQPIWRDTVALPTAVLPTCSEVDSGNSAKLKPRPLEHCFPGARPTDEEGNPLPPAYPPRDEDGNLLPMEEPIYAETVIRHRFIDFTGEYVLHCHILGHEDRGMMSGVQTVCPEGMFGKTPGWDSPDLIPMYGGRNECRVENATPAAKPCDGVLISVPGPVF